MYCLKCGKELKSGSAYCDGCGALIPSKEPSATSNNRQNETEENETRKLVFLIPVIVGIALIALGFIVRIPGGQLTTFKILDGETSEHNYAFDNKYSAIDEYVGGDAYNYIIGASLVGSKITGVMSAKAILVVGGLICFSFGMAFMLLYGKKRTKPTISAYSSTNIATYNSADHK